MLDQKFIRENPQEVQKVCQKRGVDFDVGQLLAVDRFRNKLIRDVEELRASSNEIAKQVKSAGDSERVDLLYKGSLVKKEVRVLEEQLVVIEAKWEALRREVPNLLASDVPEGATDEQNVQVFLNGEARNYNFTPLDHIELGRKFGMDFEAATRSSGSGFPLLRGKLARLEQAVLNFVLDEAEEAGFEVVSPPLLAKTEILKGLGFNPRREDDGTEIFSTEHDDLCLIGTAEIPLVGQFSDQIIDLTDGPIKLVAMTPCFRREGASGRRDAGLYRNKMFWKTELVVLCEPNSSEQTLEDIRAFEEKIFQALDLHFRVVNVAAGDLGAPAYKKYDIEAWMFGRSSTSDDGAGWGELTSCSNCTDYQARRLNIRYRNSDGKLSYAHTLNGTGVTTRALIPILEQHQNEDGTISIPLSLHKYLGKEKL